MSRYNRCPPSAIGYQESAWYGSKEGRCHSEGDQPRPCRDLLLTPTVESCSSNNSSASSVDHIARIQVQRSIHRKMMYVSTEIDHRLSILECLVDRLFRGMLGPEDGSRCVFGPVLARSSSSFIMISSVMACSKRATAQMGKRFVELLLKLCCHGGQSRLVVCKKTSLLFSPLRKESLMAKQVLYSFGNLTRIARLAKRVQYSTCKRIL